MYYIISRWPKWARWQIVRARPHGEPYPYNPNLFNSLEFRTREQANKVCDNLARSNAGEYKVTTSPIPYLLSLIIQQAHLQEAVK